MLKNTSFHIQRGKNCEEIVHKYFLNKGFQKADPQKISKNIQIDGLYHYHSSGWLIVEVKSKPKSLWSAQELVSQKQKKRILNFLNLLQSRTNEEVRAHLAVVSQEGEISLYEDFLCD